MVIFLDNVYIIIINFTDDLCPSLLPPLRGISTLRTLLFRTGSPAYHSSTGYPRIMDPVPFCVPTALSLAILRRPLWIPEIPCTCNAPWSFTATRLQNHIPAIFYSRGSPARLPTAGILAIYGRHPAYPVSCLADFTGLHTHAAFHGIRMPEYQCGHFAALPVHSARQAASSPDKSGGRTFHAATHRTIAVMAIP